MGLYPLNVCTPSVTSILQYQVVSWFNMKLKSCYSYTLSKDSAFPSSQHQSFWFLSFHKSFLKGHNQSSISERSLRLKTQCAHQLDFGSLGGSDLQFPFSILGFSEAAEPSAGKISTGYCPLCGNGSGAATSTEEPTVYIASSSNRCRPHIGVSAYSLHVEGHNYKNSSVG
ncbi:hypothetical protein Tco_0324310 [Tanacetum coccineum]